MPIQAQLASRKDANHRSVDRKVLHLATSGRTPKGTLSDVLIHDLSTDGMLIETPVKLAVGDELEVSLPRTGVKRAYVVWLSGAFFGCRFQQPISTAAVSASLLRSDRKLPTDSLSTHREASNVAVRIAELRADKGWSIDDLAERLGVSRQAVWYWETGQRVPRGDSFGKIAEVFGVTQRDLLDSGHGNAPVIDATEECRTRLADALGVPAEKIRILVEL